MPLLRRLALLVVLAFVAGAMKSCAVLPDVAVDPLGPSPEDFAIDMTILTGRADDTGAEPHLRQSRLVLMADGSLHYGVEVPRGQVRGPGQRPRPRPTETGTAAWLPPRARTLTRAQVAELWSLARQLGLTDPDRADDMMSEIRHGGNFALVRARPGTAVHLVTLTGGGHRWAFVRVSELDQPADMAMSRLANALAEMAWAGGPLEPPALVIPERRDFGPDPYERYRR